MTNWEHRKDSRSEQHATVNLKNGALLQDRLSSAADSQINQMSYRPGTFYVYSYPFTGINKGNHRDMGDGEVWTGFRNRIVRFPVEFKTKEINNEVFSFKHEDLERCLKLGKPIIMANRMASGVPCRGRPDYRILTEPSFLMARVKETPGGEEETTEKMWPCSLMRIRCMSLKEMRLFFQKPSWRLKRFGGDKNGKLGWSVSEQSWDDWIPYDETSPVRIMACYRKLLPGLFPDIEVVNYPWTKDWNRYVMP